MPQYKQVQYSLKQYGLFRPVKLGSPSRLQFIRSRMKLKKGDTWIICYQHSPVTIKGKASKLRLRTNHGSSIQEQMITLNKRFKKCRIKTMNSDYLYSEERSM